MPVSTTPRVSAATFHALVFCGLLVGCSAAPVKPEHALVEAKDARMVELADRLERQERQVEKLASRIESLSARLAASNAKRQSVAHPQEPRPQARITPSEWEDENEGTAPVLAAPSPRTAAPSPRAAAPSSRTRKRSAVSSLRRASLDDEAASSALLDGETVADSSQESMQLYYRGLQFIKEKQYEEALKSLRDFLRMSPDHVYADRAQYLISRAHFENKEYGLVIVATNLLESRYPTSFRLPDALLSRALSYAGMGQPEQARATLRDLLHRYPDNPVAGAASRHLAQLSISTPAAQP